MVRGPGRRALGAAALTVRTTTMRNLAHEAEERAGRTPAVCGAGLGSGPCGRRRAAIGAVTVAGAGRPREAPIP